MSEASPTLISKIEIEMPHMHAWIYIYIFIYPEKWMEGKCQVLHRRGVAECSGSNDLPRSKTH